MALIIFRDAIGVPRPARHARRDRPLPGVPSPHRTLRREHATRSRSRMASLSIGIVGLPNVGKSSLFQALTAVSVPAENYPFCTIDPNVGVVQVPDHRLRALAEVVDSREVTPAAVEFVDIAGLVEGASRGEGLGNQFLQHVREMDAIVHLVRCFHDESVARVGPGDPVGDLEVVETELALADLDVVGRRLERVEPKARAGDRDAEAEAELLRRILDRLDAGEPVRGVPLDGDDRRRLRDLDLLTLKPVLYLANVDESDLGDAAGSSCVRRLREALTREGDSRAEVLPVSARLEAELSGLDPGERREYLDLLGLEERGLDRLIRASYRLLDLITFFTFNRKELRAWTAPRGTTAPEAAGEVHTDFQRGFIRADAVQWDTLVDAGSMKAARDAGLVRSEGKDYVVEDGDVLLFHASA